MKLTTLLNILGTIALFGGLAALIAMLIDGLPRWRQAARSPEAAVPEGENQPLTRQPK